LRHRYADGDRNTRATVPTPTFNWRAIWAIEAPSLQESSNLWIPSSSTSQSEHIRDSFVTDSNQLLEVEDGACHGKLSL